MLRHCIVLSAAQWNPSKGVLFSPRYSNSLDTWSAVYIVIKLKYKVDKFSELFIRKKPFLFIRKSFPLGVVLIITSESVSKEPKMILFTKVDYTLSHDYNRTSYSISYTSWISRSKSSAKIWWSSILWEGFCSLFGVTFTLTLCTLSEFTSCQRSTKLFSRHIPSSLARTQMGLSS